MKRSSFQIGLSLLAVFLSGIFVGGLSHRAYSVKANVRATAGPCTPDDYRKRHIDEMRTRLSLDAEQLSSIHAILDETKQRFHNAHSKIRPEMNAIRQDEVSRIKALLREPQKPEYDKLLTERELRMRNRNKSRSDHKP